MGNWVVLIGIDAKRYHQRIGKVVQVQTCRSTKATLMSWIF